MANKKPRRGRGEGAIFWRESRKRWIAELPLEDGKSKYFSGKTYAEAQKKLNKAQLEQQQGNLATGPQQTVKQFIDYWLEQIRKPHIRINTYRIYRQYLDNHILPAFGHMRLQQLSSRQIEELYAHKLKDGYAAETIRGFHRLLHRVFKDAVKWKLMSYNICDDVNPPKPTKYQAQVLSPEQAKKLLEVAKGSRLEALLTLALLTGMRRGELLALRWADINFEEAHLLVNHTVNRIGKRFAEQGIVENDPKTETSRRKILLPPFAIEVLRQHREQQAVMRVRAGTAWQERDLVFSNSWGGFMEGSHTTARFKQLLKKAGLPSIRFHDLRHTIASILADMGVQPKQVQELLGHSNIAITMNRYSHLFPSRQREMMEKLDDFFRG